ncbi:hypothetical protein [Jiangella endophytica]|uniref:hypothetical protein n=1 Tax=Jiangella endophytica TaxID=1623398 RepID=UPI000E349D95|nr:hypothetical protein [Jiangella endophytica]
MSRSTRSASLLGAAAALVLGLTACSSDGGSDYCDLLSDDSGLSDFDPSDEAAMEEAANRVQEVVDAAPDDIKADWETFATAIEDPEAAAADDPEAFMTAMENITQHAQDECDIDINS